jgi:hypothetical protein
MARMRARNRSCGSCRGCPGAPRRCAPAPCRCRSRAAAASAGHRRHLLELHEHEVPDLDEAVAFRVRRARRPAGDVVPVVIEDFRARSARAGVAHGPEVVRRRDADDALFRQPGDAAPQVEGVVVLGEHRDGQPVLGQPELLGDQVPGQLDRQVLEVVAEGEVAQHLEERVVARGVADVVEVIVLAPGAHAFLRRHGAAVGPALEPGEHVLELHHAGVGEHESRVVARHQRPRRHDLVAVPGEVVEERGADLVDGGHAFFPWRLASPHPLVPAQAGTQGASATSLGPRLRGNERDRP